MLIHDYTFRKASPVWEKGTAYDMNRTICFVATLPATNQTVKLAAFIAAPVAAVFAGKKR